MYMLPGQWPSESDPGPKNCTCYLASLFPHHLCLHSSPEQPSLHLHIELAWHDWHGEYQDVRKGHGLDDEGGGEVGLQGLNAERLPNISPKAFSLSSLPSPSYNCLQLFCHQAQLHNCQISLSL